jgi:uncharacterized protein YjbI with pentapeptide repeats
MRTRFPSYTAISLAAYFTSLSLYLMNVHLVGGCLRRASHRVCISQGVHLTGVYLMGVYFTGVHLMGVYFTGVHLMDVYLTGVHLMLVHLMGVYLMGVYVIGMHLIGVYIMGVHLMGVHHRMQPFLLSGTYVFAAFGLIPHFSFWR